MDNVLKLTILSPERRLLESVTVEEVTLPTSEGQIQILPGHAPMIGVLETGLFHYRIPSQGPSSGVLSTGFFEVKNNEVSLMAETLEAKSEINLERAKRAQQLAEKTLQDADLDEHKFKKYQLKLQRSILRQQLAGREHSE